MSAQLLVRDKWEGRKGGKGKETRERFRKGKGPGREVRDGRRSWN
jgi:hypothetical protein